MKSLFSAISFLTILPIKHHIVTPLTIAYFPLVGFFLGGILLLLNFIFSQFLFFTKDITTVLLLVIYIILTGVLHIDALSDTVDALVGGGKDKTKILSIMSDVHIGAGGVSAIVCDILLKFILLKNIPSEIFQNVLLIFPVISRWTMVLSMYLSKPAKGDGVGKLVIENTNMTSFVISTLICFIITLLLFLNITGIILILFSGIVTIATTKFLNSKIDGMTGDTLGTVNEISEISVLIVLLTQDILSI